jgi:hypothetical protein
MTTRTRKLAPQPPLTAMTRGGDLPLSFAQQRLWFLAQIEPASTALTDPLLVRVRGALDVAALQAALREVVRRHEVLRTRFPLRGGRPVQEIGDAVPPLVVEEAPAGAAEAPDLDAMLRQWAQSVRAEPFDLTRDPLVRARLLRFAAEDHVLLLVMHHIVFDGWSMGVLWQELGQLYPGCRAGQQSPLPLPAVQYADFALWQRQWLQGDVLEQQLAYWRGQLAGVPDLKLPTARARTAQLAGRGTRLRFTWGAELTEQIKALSRAARATLFMTVLAGLQVVLGRFAQQELFAIGTPITGRTRPEVESLIGCFINMLVLRADLRGNPTFRQLLGRARETCLGAYAHQDFPFEHLVNELQPARDPTRAPLFEVTLGVQNAPRTALTLPGLDVETLHHVLAETPTNTLYDITVWVTVAEHVMHVTWQYRTELFDAAVITRLNQDLETLLRAASGQPDADISYLRLELHSRNHRERPRPTRAAGMPARPSLALRSGA